MKKLESYAVGSWYQSGADGLGLSNAVTGEPLATISSDGLDFSDMLTYARSTGGSALRKYTFHQRALMLKELAKYLMQHKEEFYALSAATGATRRDSWVDIEGGISTLFVYSSKGRREMPNDQVYLDGPQEAISREGSFTARHISTPLRGAAVHINAYNFPCWGMLEKLAPTLIAGMPAIVKPASNTAYLTELMFRRIVESGILPEGAVQLVCGSVGDLLDHLTGQDVVSFTGSASTGTRLRQHQVVAENSVRFMMEADSLNCSILGEDVEPGSEDFDIYIKEVAREMTAKAGQKCTAIRRAFVPADRVDAVVESLSARLAKTTVGDPADESVRMGALAGLDQREEVRERVGEIAAAGEIVFGQLEGFDVVGADPVKGAFLPPILLLCNDTSSNEMHDIEAFGPVSTIMPYESREHAVELAARGKGSLVGSVITSDEEFAREVVLGASPYHGRILVLNKDCAGESTGHGTPLPHLVHGGPGRAGGSEEMGGIRGIKHYMQRTALQGSPDMLTAITHSWATGSKRKTGTIHPFQKHFDELEVGDTVVSEKRTITLDDIEAFAALSGDRFYAHMDEAAAKRNPFFEGRVAHGYFIVSMAAGLFVWPGEGPVLANYGLDDLRFTEPVYPGDELEVLLTCKQKTVREGEDYGEVRWDTTVVKSDGSIAANYDVLTMVARNPAH